MGGAPVQPFVLGLYYHFLVHSIIVSLLGFTTSSATFTGKMLMRGGIHSQQFPFTGKMVIAHRIHSHQCNKHWADGNHRWAGMRIHSQQYITFTGQVVIISGVGLSELSVQASTVLKLSACAHLYMLPSRIYFLFFTEEGSLGADVKYRSVQTFSIS